MKISSIDFLIRLKNISYNSCLNTIYCPYTKTNSQIAKILYEEGFIISYGIGTQNLNNQRLFIKINLRVTDGLNNISKIKIFSTPKKKVALSYTDLCRFDLKGKEYFLFTDKGLKSAHSCLQEKLGGVLAFRI